MNAIKFNRKEKPAGKTSTLLKRAMTYKRIILPLLVLLTCLVISYINWNVANSSAENEFRTYLEYRARDVKNRIEQRIIGYEQILKSTRGLYNASVNVNRTEFRTFFNSLSLNKNYPGLQGIGFSLIVSPEQIKKHITGIREEGFPEYKIWPENKRETYTSIIYLEPFRDRNPRALGYDMYSEPIRRETMETARDSNETILSGKVNLVQETDKEVQAGFLIYLPVYKNGTPYSTIKERRSNIIGWVYSPFRMNDFMEGLFGEHAEDLDVKIYDSKNISNDTKMYDSKTDTARLTRALVLKKEIDINGHLWTVIIKSTPNLETRIGFNTATIILLVGISISLLLTIITWLLENKRRQTIIAKRERERTEETLKKSEENYRNLVDDALVGVYKISLEGNIIWANQAMLNIIEYDGDDYTRLNVIGFYKNPGDRDELSRVLKEKGEMKNYETELISYKGKSLNVNINMKIEGSVITGMLLDITERKQAESIVKKTNEELIKLNAEKDKFFSIIAHDLKSPFNGFLTLTELMADKTEKFSLDEFAEHSESLNKAAINLYKLLENLLEWAQIQNGSINFTPQKSDLSKLVRQSIETIHQRALQKRNYNYK